MAKFKEVVYMCLDLLKQVSDDAYYTTDHVMFLLNHFRTFVLKKTYADIKKEIPDSNYQTVCLDLEKVQGIDGDLCSGTYLKSVQTLPGTINIAEPRIYLGDYLSEGVTFVSPERFPNTGYNRYLRNIIYCALGNDNKLMLKASNPQFLYLEKIKVSAIFEDSQEATSLSCEEGAASCDPMEQDYPLESALIPSVVELVVKELSGAVLQPKDYQNNASDDLSDLNNFVRRNMKSNLQKQLTND